MENHHLCCSCECDSHTIRYSYISGNGFPELYTSVSLNPEVGFFKRLYFSFRYLFNLGDPIGDGHYCCTIFEPKRTKKLIAFLQECINDEESSGEEEDGTAG